MIFVNMIIKAFVESFFDCVNTIYIFIDVETMAVYIDRFGTLIHKLDILLSFLRKKTGLALLN